MLISYDVSNMHEAEQMIGSYDNHPRVCYLLLIFTVYRLVSGRDCEVVFNSSFVDAAVHLWNETFNFSFLCTPLYHCIYVPTV